MMTLCSDMTVILLLPAIIWFVLLVAQIDSSEYIHVYNVYIYVYVADQQSRIIYI